MSKQKKNVTEFRSYQLPVDFPVLLLTGSQWRISDVQSANLHFHNCLEIGICHEGEGTMIVRSQHLAFSSGTITCVARNIPHTTYSAPGTSSLWSYIFTDPQEFLDPLTVSYANRFSQICEQLDAARVIAPGQCEHGMFYINEIIRNITDKPHNYQLKTRTDMLSFFVQLINDSPVSRDTDTKSSPKDTSTLAIVPALNYINQNYMTSFPIDYLAEICGLSPTHFRRIFSLAMGGFSPLEYLNTIRISKACNLLRSSEESVLNISEAVGFHSISSFNRYFSRMVGMSPREYRCADSSDERLRQSKIIEYNGWLEPDI